MTTRTAPQVPAGRVGESQAAQSLPLYRMPLVWVAVLVPAGFLFWLFFLTPPL